MSYTTNKATFAVQGSAATLFRRGG